MYGCIAKEDSVHMIMIVYLGVTVKCKTFIGKSRPAAADKTVYSEIKPGKALGNNTASTAATQCAFLDKSL